MVKWLRNSKISMCILTILRIYLGIQWVLDGWEKITTKGGFDASGLIQSAIKNPVLTPGKTKAFPWYDWFLNFATNQGHSTSSFSFLVSWGEFLVGLGFIFGTFTLAAAFFGLVMNYSYLGAGVVSVNPTFIFIGTLSLVGGYNSGRLGLDHWVTPYLRSKIGFLENDINI